MIVLFILTLKIAQSREDINQSEYNRIVKKLFSLPEAVSESLKIENRIQVMAKEFSDAKGSMFLEEVYHFQLH